MCLVAVPLAISALGAAASYASQAKADKYATEAGAVQATAAKESALREYGQLGRREYEESTAAASEIANTVSQAQATIGSAAVGEAAAGVAGKSTGDLYREYARQEGNSIANTMFNRNANKAALRDETGAVRSRLAVGLVQSNPGPPRANLLGTGLGFAGGAINTLNQFGVFKKEK